MSGAVATAAFWHEETELAAAVRDVASRMAGALGAMRAGHGRRAAVVREVRTAEAAYRVRGNVLEHGSAEMPAIVVMLERLDEELPTDDELRTVFGLTRTELRVARLLAESKTNGEIADALTISPHTARHHTERILSKLQVGSRRAVRERLIEAAYAVR